MNIGEVLIENIPQLWMGMVGILLNSIVVGTLFGKRKYDWFFPVICSVRFIIYNIVILYHVSFPYIAFPIAKNPILYIIK